MLSDSMICNMGKTFLKARQGAIWNLDSLWQMEKWRSDGGSAPKSSGQKKLVKKMGHFN